MYLFCSNFRCEGRPELEIFADDIERLITDRAEVPLRKGR